MSNFQKALDNLAQSPQAAEDLARKILHDFDEELGQRPLEGFEKSHEDLNAMRHCIQHGMFPKVVQAYPAAMGRFVGACAELEAQQQLAEIITQISTEK